MKDMMMIVLEAEMKTGMVMGEKEIGIPTAVMVIVMVEILKSDMAEMATEMMIPGEEVKVWILTIMVREVEALIEIETAPMRTMVNFLLGTSYVFFGFTIACNYVSGETMVTYLYTMYSLFFWFGIHSM